MNRALQHEMLQFLEHTFHVKIRAHITSVTSRPNENPLPEVQERSSSMLWPKKGCYLPAFSTHQQRFQHGVLATRSQHDQHHLHRSEDVRSKNMLQMESWLHARDWFLTHEND